MELFHGSENIIRHPKLDGGKKNNDYGRGFYCTHEYDLAGEWACRNGKDGYINRYVFHEAEMKVLNLVSADYNILNWLALLLKNRTFRAVSDLAADAREYILDNFLIDTDGYDVIVGYRADDSYFSYAQGFIENSLPLGGLNRALRSGKLGIQTVLVSEKAFTALEFENYEAADRKLYYPQFANRDFNAREDYRNSVRHRRYVDDIFVMDILREEMRGDDKRIQRIVSE